MTERFGDAAAQLWGAASILLGWRPDEFWSATPAELMGALQGPAADTDVPDGDLIADLRRRFPDD